MQVFFFNGLTVALMCGSIIYDNVNTQQMSDVVVKQLCLLEEINERQKLA